MAFLQQEGATQQPYWQQQTNYTIEATLNDQNHSLEGLLQLEYINNAPDTLHFIWFHVWPNAFKNDRTAFSDQLLENGRTDFYFSGKEDKGYLNRLDFRANGITLEQEDHPQYADIIKLHLSSPLAPGERVMLNASFYVKLPANFSRGGHTGQSYQVTQWYPKPAVYDQKGWHPMPYLDQGEFYGEFGNFDVTIHLPAAYRVAATGELQGGERRQELLKPNSLSLPGSAYKTLRYKQDNIHDFAWFADKRFIVRYDTLQLLSGRVIETYAYYLPASEPVWKNSIRMLKEAVRYRSALIAEYPFNVITVVEAKMGVEGGMEYPTIASISTGLDETLLEEVIGHEAGHNWFYGILGSNERLHPWMDEGMNTYYDNRYREWITENRKNAAPPGPGAASKGLGKQAEQAKTSGAADGGSDWLRSRLPADPYKYLIDALAKIKADQPISGEATAFNNVNYPLMVYYKAAAWMKGLEQKLGTTLFDSAMKTYYEQWKFRHPYPGDFRSVMESVSGTGLSDYFALLDRQGALPPLPAKRKIKPVFLFSARNTDSIQYIHIMPAIGYNVYDRLMAGVFVHNYNLPENSFRFFLNPLYATGSNGLRGMGGLAYSWRPDKGIGKLTAGINGSAFSTREGRDSAGKKVFADFYKLVPFARVVFKNRDKRDNREAWAEWKTYIIGERGFRYDQYSADSLYYPSRGDRVSRYLNQLSFNYARYRALYPYDLRLQLQQGESFYRVNAEANYFFNYAKGGGLSMRLFAAKFGYLGARTQSKIFAAYPYQPKLTAVRGNEDYTYSNYFIGRNESDGLASQQIMVRDGGLKIRTDLFQGLQGRSDNWIAALNFNTTLPQLLPVKLPIRLFLDVGTYSDAWRVELNNARLMYVAGLQLSLFKELVNIYAPLLMSAEVRNSLKTVPEENTFGKRISFSIDLHRFNLRKLTGNQFPF